MAPRNKFSREEIVRAAFEVVRENGADALTAKAIALRLGVSTRPVFTSLGTMEEVRREVSSLALRYFEDYAEEGLKENVPFHGFGMRYIGFAREEPELYRLLFLRPPVGERCGISDTLTRISERVAPSLVAIYHITPAQAGYYFRDLWLVVHSLATLIVSGECPYTDREIGQILTDFSVGICCAIKQIPGFCGGTYDRDAVFRRLTADGR